MQDPAHDRAVIRLLAQRAAEAGGRVYYVGGCVRDALMGRESKDYDVEVHGLSPAALEAILDTLGERIAIGESFGVYALRWTSPCRAGSICAGADTGTSTCSSIPISACARRRGGATSR